MDSLVFEYLYNICEVHCQNEAYGSRKFRAENARYHISRTSRASSEFFPQMSRNVAQFRAMHEFPADYSCGRFRAKCGIFFSQAGFLFLCARNFSRKRDFCSCVREIFLASGIFFLCARNFSRKRDFFSCVREISLQARYFAACGILSTCGILIECCDFRSLPPCIAGDTFELKDVIAVESLQSS